ncbi:MAG: hypothetical protein K0U68_16740 [Gammaproteobacteria bacterium]|nr:hypothetical protein [Gammaproteobacteria bacterium]
MTLIVQVIVALVSVIPLAELSWWVLSDQSGIISDDFLLAYSGLWALNFMVFFLAIKPAMRITGFQLLASLQTMMGWFAAGYAVVHAIVWLAIDLHWNWSFIAGRIEQDLILLCGAAGLVGLLLLFINPFDALDQLTSKLLVPVVAVCLIHFFFVTTEDRTMPGIYTGVFLTLLGYRGKHAMVPKSVPELVSRLLKK